MKTVLAAALVFVAVAVSTVAVARPHSKSFYEIWFSLATGEAG